MFNHAGGTVFFKLDETKKSIFFKSFLRDAYLWHVDGHLGAHLFLTAPSRGVSQFSKVVPINTCLNGLVHPSVILDA